MSNQRIVFRRYGRRQSGARRAKVLPETVVYRLEKGPGGKLAAVHTKSPDGVSTRRTARYFVLAAHAVEIPKLMLVSEVGNSSDQVGRNLMSHPSHFYECLAKDALWPGRGPIQQGSVNDRCDGPHRAKHAAIRYGSNNRSAHLRFTDQLLKEGIIGRELDERIRHDTSRYVSITTGMEMLPNPANRITLSDRKDSLGLPTPRIYFDVDEYCGNASIVAHEDFKQFDKAFEIQTRLGDRDAWRFAAHIMGSTIIGADPRTSVVDADCRSHDHSNLFIASTGVMPSSATWNPTLTGCALALRLAEVVAREA